MLHQSLGLLLLWFWLPLSFNGTWSASMHKIHLTLQELLDIVLMLHRMAMAFHLSGKVVALHWITVLLHLIL